MRTFRAGRLYGAALAGALVQLTSPGQCPAQEPADDQDAGAYGYVRIVEGSISFIQSDTGERAQAEANEPILVGDQLILSGGARAELLLADRNLVRLGDRAEVAFVALAASPDRNDRSTVLDLRDGSMELVVARDYEGEAPPAVETPNAYVEVSAPGAYLVLVEGQSRVVVVVRDGTATIRTDQGLTRVGRGEEAIVEGFEGSQVRLAAARGLVDLEGWGRRLASDVDGAELDYIDEPLRYSAAPLYQHGSWIYVRGRTAWRPHVRAGWRPYWYGRWRHTPTGLFWVSSEPWGWVPYHYGSWDHVPGFGWVWFPGRTFSTAWVFWYWGPEYVGWVPTGYYAHHYGPRFRFYFGVYGRAGGRFAGFGDWCFTRVSFFGRRHQHRHLRTGRGLGRTRGRLREGFITTDTRRIKAHTWKHPERVAGILRDGERNRIRREEKLPDMSPFIRREPRLPPPVENLVLVDRPARSPDLGSQPGILEPRTRTRIVETPAARNRTAETRSQRPIIEPRTRTRIVETPAARNRTAETRSQRPIVEPRTRTRIVETPAARTRTAETRSQRPIIEPRTRTRVVQPRSEPKARALSSRKPERSSARAKPRTSERSSPSVQRTRTQRPARTTGNVRAPKRDRSSSAKPTGGGKRASPARTAASRSARTSSRPTRTTRRKSAN
jgi:hypothetical protein